MDLDWLKDFLALTEHESFSRAADARHVTQSAFNRRIRALEDWVRTPLFVRDQQGATLTSAGMHFQTFAVDLMRDVERARRDMLAVGEEEAGMLSIAATHALSFTFFPRWISRYLHYHALGALNLISDSFEACERMMLGGEVHLLLCHTHSSAPTRLEVDRFERRYIADDVLIPVCRPDADGLPRWSLPGTADAPVPGLSYSSASGLGRILASHPRFNGEAVHIETIFTSQLATTLMNKARDRQGVAWLPETLIREDLERKLFVRAGDKAFDIKLGIQLFRSPECRNRAAGQLWATEQDSPFG
jgi:DNA-binding transcriptional LysR family regulator